MRNFIVSLLIFMGSVSSLLANGELCIVDLRYSSEDIPHFDHLVICEQSDTIGIEIQAPSSGGLSNLQLSLDLPEGLTYAGFLSVVPTGASMTLSTDVQNPVFLLPNISAGAKLKVFFTLEANCAIKTMWENLDPINIGYNIAYSGGSFSYTPALEYNTQIYVPVLNIIHITPSYPIVVPGETIQRQIFVSQDGIRAWLKNFTYQNEYNGTVEYISMSISNGLGQNTVNLPFDDDGMEVTAYITEQLLSQIGLNGVFDENQELIITETIRVTNCDTDILDHLFKTTWGCDDESCETNVEQDGISIVVGNPYLVVSEGAINDNGLCGTSVYNYTVTNDGYEFVPNSGFAKDIVLQIDPSCELALFQESYTIESILIDGISYPLPIPTPEGTYNFVINSLENVDTDGMSDDLNLGGSFNVQITMSTNCSNTSCTDPSVCNGDVLLGLRYNNPCDLPKAKVTIPVVSNTSYAIGAGYIDGTPLITASATPFVINYCYGYYDDTNLCPGATVSLKITDSSGQLDLLSALLDNGQQQLAVSLTPVAGEPNSYLIGGGTLGSGFIYDCWNINVLYNDVCGFEGSVPIEFEVIYDCPCGGCSIVRACDTYYSYIQNACVGICNDLTTDLFTVERTSFSYTTESMNSLANSNTPGVVLNKAYTCDHVKCEMVGEVNNDNATNVGVSFNLFVPANENPYEFVNAQLFINNLPVNCIITAPAMQLIAPGQIEMNFNFQSCLMQNNIVLHNGDQLRFVVNSKIVETPWMNGSFSLTQLVGGFYSIVNNSINTCSPLAKDFYVANPTVNPVASSTVNYGCNGNITVNGNISIMSATEDDFPNEYRPWYGDVSVTIFEIPDGFTYIPNSGILELLSPDYMSLPISPVITNNGTTITFTNTNGNWPEPDKNISGNQLQFSFELASNCLEVTNESFHFGYTLVKNMYAQPFEPTCLETISTNDTKQIVNDPPILTLNPIEINADGLSNVVSWDLQVCNVSAYDAPFVWLGFENLSNQFEFISLEDVTNPLQPVAYPLTNYTTGSSAYGMTANISAGDCRIYRVNAHFTACEDVEIVTAKLGWSCVNPLLIAADEFPTQPNCGGANAAVDLSFKPYNGKIQADLINFSSTIGLCEAGMLEMEFKNVKESYIYDVILEIVLPIDGIEFNPNSFEIAYPSGDVYQPITQMPQFIGVNPLGRLYRFNLSDLIPEIANGFIPVPEEILNRFMLRFQYTTDCNFASGDIIRFGSYGYLPCGEISDGTIQGAPVLIDGAIAPYLASYEISVQDITPCEPVSTTFTTRVTNNGPGIMGSYDFLRLRLPIGITYVPNTVANTFPSTWLPGEPEINMIYDMQELVWQLPPSIGAGQIAEISFDIEGQESITCFSDEFLIETYTYGLATCNAGNNPDEVCSIQINTGSDNQTLDVNKPDVQFLQNTSIYASCNGNMGEQLNAHIEFINLGEPINAGVTTYFSFIQDVNGNGVQDANDLLIYSIAYTDPIPSFQSMSIDRIFDIEAGMSCPLLLIIDDVNNCICSQPLINFPEFPYYNAGNDVDICSNVDSQIGCEPVVGYSYEWSSITDPTLQYLSCTDCANPYVNIPNSSPSPITHIYNLTTTRGQYLNSCTTSDQVTITVSAGAEIPGPTYNLCEGESIQFAGYSTSSPVLWTPINGFGDINSINPTVEPIVGTTYYYMNFTNDQGCPLRYKITTNVEANPQPEIIVDGDISFCDGTGSIQLSVNGDFASYNWYRTGNSQILATTSVYSPSLSGSYYVVVTSNTMNQCPGAASEPVMITVEEFNQPVIWPQGSITVCPNEFVSFFVLGDYPMVLWYNINDPAPLGSPVGIGPIFTTDIAGTYYVVATDENGCSGNSPNSSVNILPQQAMIIQSNGLIDDIVSLCNGESLNLTVSPALFQNYEWYYNGSLIAGNNISFTATLPGSYEVRAVDANGCNVLSEPLFVQLSEIPNPGVEVDGEQIFCSGENIILSVTEPHETYQWYKNGQLLQGANNFELTVSSSGTYSVTVTDNGCSGTSFEIPVTVIPQPFVQIQSNTNNQLCMGEIVTITASANFAQYTWYKDGAILYNQQGNIIQISDPGTYYVEIQDQNGCNAISNYLEVDFHALPEPIIIANEVCQGGNGIIEATPGFSQYYWYLNGVLQIGQNGNTLNISNEGVVIVEVVDLHGCTGVSDPVTLDYFPVPPVNLTTNDTEICAGKTIFLSANSSAVSYSWTPDIWLSCTDCVMPVATPLNNVTYTVTITDQNGCTNTESISIIVHQPDFITMTIDDNKICEGETTTLSAPLGYDMYTWILNGVTTIGAGSQNTITVSEQGWYSVQVTNEFGCQSESRPKFLRVYEPKPILINVVGPETFCENESTSIVATLGFASYDWYVDGALIQSGISNAFQTNDSGDVYVIGITPQGCPIQSESVEILSFPNPMPQIFFSGSTTLCPGESIVLSVPGVYPSIVWKKGNNVIANAVTNSITVSEPGLYSVFVDDLQGCNGQALPIEITYYPNQEFSFGTTEYKLCDPNELPYILNGPAGFSNYAWYKNGAILVQDSSNPMISLNESGDYTLTITDVNGCTFSSMNYFSLDVYEPLLLNIQPVNSVLCLGESTTIFSSDAATSYSWSPIAGLSCSDCPNPIAEPLTTTTYTLTIVDGNGCTATASTIITVHDIDSPVLQASDLMVCQGSSVTLNTVPGYDNYKWYRNECVLVACGEFMNSFVVDESGLYSVTVENEYGCEVSSNSVEITVFSNPIPTLSFVSENSICEGLSVIVQAQDGFASYNWYVNGALAQAGNSNMFTLNDSGELYVEVVDGNGCTGHSESLYINVNPQPQPEIILGSNNTVCAGEMVTMSIIGFYEEVQWHLNGVAIPAANGNVYQATVPGSYTVYVNDHNGCEATSSPVSMINYLMPSVAITPDNVSLCGSLEQEVSLTATSGFINYKWYSYGLLLIQDSNNNILTTSTSGIYSVLVTDANGCTALSEPVNVNLDVTSPVSITASDDHICVGESVQLYASGNATSYTWSPQNGSLSCANCPMPIATPIVNTNYQVTIIDANGCESSDNIIVLVDDVQIPQILLDDEGTNTACEGDFVSLSATSGFENYQWIRDTYITVQNGESPILAATESGNYTVIATNGAGCETASQSVAIEIMPIPEVEIAISGENPFCEGGSILLSASNGLANYEWYVNGSLYASFGYNQIELDINANVQLVATSENGCSFTSDMITVYVDPLPQPTIYVAGSTDLCQGEQTLLSVAGIYQEIIWYRDGQPVTNTNTNVYIPTQSGSYSVYVNDGNGCAGTSLPVAIQVSQLNEVLVSGGGSICGEDGFTTLTATPGFEHYYWYKNEILLVQSSNSFTFNATEAGEYSVIVEDMNGCTAYSNDVDVIIYPMPPLNLNASSLFVCPGELVQLSVNSNASTINWSTTDPSISCTNCANPTIQPLSSNTYQVEIVDQNGCAVNGLLNVQVESTGEIEISGVQEICEFTGLSMLSVSAAYNNYQWFHNGLPIYQANSPFLSATSAGDYVVTASSGDDCGIVSAVFELTYLPSPQPHINVIGPASLCGTNDNTVVLDAGLNSNGISHNAYTWFYQDNIIVGNSQTLTPTATGAYTVLVTSPDGCTNVSEPVYIAINPSVPSPAIYINGSNSICDNNEVEIFIAGDYETILWYNLSNPSTPVNLYSTNIIEVGLSGTYYAVVTDVNGCTATSGSITVTNINLPQPVITGDFSICDGEHTLLQVQDLYDSYTWYWNNIELQGFDNPSINVNEAGTYYVIVASMDGSCSATSDPITVLTSSPLAIHFEMPTTACLGENVMIQYEGVVANTYNYTWDFDGGTHTGNLDQGYLVQWNSPGSHTVSLTVTTGNCSYTASNTIEVGSVNLNVIPYVTPITNCGLNGGIIQLVISGNQNDVQVEWTGPNSFSATGLGISNLSPGIYWATVTDSNGCETSVSAEVYAIDTPIYANDDYSYTNQNIATTICVLNNDQGTSMSIGAILDNPNNGTVQILGNGCITYNPTFDFCGEDSFTYQMVDACGQIDLAIAYITIYCEDNNPPITTDTLVYCTSPMTPVEICPGYSDPDGNGLLITDGFTTWNCTLTFLNDECIEYLPLPGFEGTDTIFLTVCDNQIPPACSEAVILIQVGCIAPIAVPDQLVLDCDNLILDVNGLEYYNVDVLNNDLINNQCSNDAVLTVTIPPAHGTATVSNTNSVQYFPQAGYSGSDQLTYMICNGCGVCNSTTVSLNIPDCDNGNNPNPNPCDQLTQYCTGSMEEITICPDFCELEGLDYSITSVLTNHNCNLTIPTMHCIAYTSVPLFIGTEVLEVEACTSTGVCQTIFININVGPCANVSLQANADMAFTTSNQGVYINVLENDLGNQYYICSYNFPANGTLIAQDGGMYYSPQTGFSGIDSFTYVLCNEAGEESTANVQIAVSTGCNNSVTVCHSPGIPLQLCPDFCMVQNAVINNVNPSTGFAVSTSQSGNCVWVTPNNNSIQSGSIQITGCANNVCESINYSINFGCVAPVSMPDYVISEVNESSIIDVIANDFDPCGNALHIEILGDPANGSAIITSSGQIQYTPNSGFVGNDSFVYLLCNDCNPNCVPTTVSITLVAAVSLVANDDNVLLEKNAQAYIDITRNDVAPAGMACSVTEWTTPNNGSLTLLNEAFMYKPQQNFVGVDSFQYTLCVNNICDLAWVKLHVSDAMIAQDDQFNTSLNMQVELPVLENDLNVSIEPIINILQFPAQGQVVVNTNATLTYQPNQGFIGTDSLIYEVCNTDLTCTQASVVINVLQENIVLDAIDDHATTNVQNSIVVDVLNNDLYDASHTIAINSITQPENGQAILVGDQINYIPNDGFNGIDQFSYTLCNQSGICDVALVTVEVKACDLIVPDAFSPNGDGVNEFYTIGNISCYNTSKIIIFNRWGNQVWSDENLSDSQGWDGRFEKNGEALPDGTYFYVLYYGNEGSQQDLSGYITLRR